MLCCRAKQVCKISELADVASTGPSSFRTCRNREGCGKAAQDLAITHPGPPPTSTFRLVKAQAISSNTLKIFFPASSQSSHWHFPFLLSQVKLVWEAFPEAFCLHLLKPFDSEMCGSMFRDFRISELLTLSKRKLDL